MNASWSASYDVRVDTKNQAVQLLYYGSVRNTTGEDWKDVKLFLSTASPSTNAAPPPLKTLRVRFPVPKHVYKRKFQFLLDFLFLLEDPLKKNKSFRGNNILFC